MKYFVFLLTVLLLLGTGSPLGAIDAIVGQPEADWIANVTTEYGTIVQVLDVFESGTYGGTGSLLWLPDLSTYAVLTAAHNINMVLPSGRPPYFGYALQRVKFANHTVDEQGNLQEGQTETVNGLGIQHPGYLGSDGTRYVENDLGLILLDHVPDWARLPVSLAPQRVPEPREPGEKKPIDIIGGEGQPRMRKGKMGLEQGNTIISKYRFVPDPHFAVRGDSGGPSYFDFGLGPQVVGVTSLGRDPFQTIAVRVDGDGPHHDWVLGSEINARIENPDPPPHYWELWDDPDGWSKGHPPGLYEVALNAWPVPDRAYYPGREEEVEGLMITPGQGFGLPNAWLKVGDVGIYNGGGISIGHGWFSINRLMTPKFHNNGVLELLSHESFDL